MNVYLDLAALQNARKYHRRPNSSEMETRVILSDADKFMSVARRMGLWFGSLLLGITLFSLLMTLSPSGVSQSFQVGAVLLVFRITMTFAFPAWCLYLPFVMALQDAEERRGWTLLVSGILIGPASLVLWGLILQVRGGDPQKIWHGNPPGFGMNGAMIFALIVGFLTTSCYVIALKVLHHRSTATKGRFTRT